MIDKLLNFLVMDVTVLGRDVADTHVLLSAVPDQPIYNIKAVGKRTGLTPATLRAWERRYRMPSPNRTEQGYRLYSERDIAILFWLQQQIQQGQSVSQAALRLQSILDSGQDIEMQIPQWIAANEPADWNRPRSPEALRYDLTQAFEQFDIEAADDVLTEAAALYTLETTVIHILYDTYSDQDKKGAVRSFALNYARQWLLHTLQVTPTPKMKSAVIVIGFPNEQSEIDLLILCLLLRRQGFPVTYLGNDLDPSLLDPSLAANNTGLIVYYADKPENVAKLSSAPALHDERGKPVSIAYAGQSAPPDASPLTATYLGSDLRAIVKSIMQRLRDTDSL